MLLELSPDQEFFRETTAKFLGDRASTTDVRAKRDDPAGFDRDYWRQGAELGWTSLLVSEADGGGSLSGKGVVDLTVVAHEFGRHAAPGPLGVSNVVAAALSDVGSDAQKADALAAVLAGEAVATWCFSEPSPNDRLGALTLTVERDGSDVVLSGAKEPVESAGDADYLLVTGTGSDGPVQVLVPAGTPGVSVREMKTVDLTRRFGAVSFDGVRMPESAVVGTPGDAGQVERQLQLALVVQAAESVGAIDRAFDITIEWAFDRYTFGRPLASYQAIKHRFADMKSWLEASHAVADAAADAVDARSARAAEWVSVAKAYIGQVGPEMVQDCVQLHGGIGVTFDHDLHLFLRRATLNRGLYGSVAEHRQRITTIVEGGTRS
jgi:alkylation response protein AidB-like acyl-CoA dehydrogenase